MRNAPLLIVAMLSFAFGCATGGISTPLPADIRVQAPDAGVPKDAALFSGKWVGNWGGQLDHALVVERIEGTTAFVVYSYGTSQSMFINQPGFFRARGTIDDGVLTVPTRQATVTYRLVDGGTKLSGQFQGTITTQGVFHKVAP